MSHPKINTQAPNKAPLSLKDQLAQAAVVYRAAQLKATGVKA